MTDKELLECAAKAAGIALENVPMMGAGLLLEKGGVWNPLEDDGDALRLAVKLRLDVLWAEHEKSVVVCNDSSNKELIAEKVRFTDDPYAATRRAIVRAAAEIGRNMK
jgi:hypothetical protein